MKDDIVLKDILFTNYRYSFLREKNANISDYSEGYETTVARYVVNGQIQMTAGQIAACRNKELEAAYQKYMQETLKLAKLLLNQGLFITGFSDAEMNCTEQLMDELKNLLFLIGFEKKERMAMLYNAQLAKEKRWNNNKAVEMMVKSFLPCFVKLTKMQYMYKFEISIEAKRDGTEILTQECYKKFEQMLCDLYRENYDMYNARELFM